MQIISLLPSKQTYVRINPSIRRTFAFNILLPNRPLSVSLFSPNKTNILIKYNFVGYLVREGKAFFRCVSLGPHESILRISNLRLSTLFIFFSLSTLVSVLYNHPYMIYPLVIITSLLPLSFPKSFSLCVGSADETMLAMEQILSELNGEELNEQGLPPGFRFHPTDEELITFYLASKVFKGNFCGVEIAEVDLNRCEPWELPDVAKMGEREWYFYSLRDRKYPTGLRTNRATGAGYWKATGKDREVYSAINGGLLIGMKKTLVFYKGRAPRGEKTKWVMHEYRLDGDFSYRHACKEEWVICRIFHKNGEKKNPIMFPCQTYLMESGLSSSTTSNSLPPLLETTRTTLIECQSQAAMQAFQNPFQIHQQPHPQPENDLKSFVSSVVSQSNLFSSSEQPLQQQSTFSHKSPNSTTTNTTIANANNNNIMYTPSPSSSLLPSILFKSLLSHQDSTLLKQQQCDVFKQFKAESSFSTHFEPAETNSNFMDIKIHPLNPPSYHQHPLFFEMECNSPPPPAAEVSVHDMSSSIAFNRPGYPTILDPHINIVHAHGGESWPLDA